MVKSLAGLGKKERFQLSQVLKSNPSVITPQQAATALKISANQAAQLLAAWNQKGWLSRIKRGVYIPVSLQANNPEVMADEPWTLAKALFNPCYIGGWSAAEYWDLTEQVFNSTMVFTSRKVLQRNLKLKGVSFTLKTTKQDRFFGTTNVWLQNQKIEISDPTKTIVDAFNDPAVVGGIRMAVDMLDRYMNSENKNLDLVLQYATRIGNTAIFKRLGFIFESQYPQEITFIQTCHNSLKSGYSQLDPSTPAKNLVTAWKLWVTPTWKKVLRDHN